MVKCPGCNATLPDMATQCQFCGAQFAGTPANQTRGYARPVGPQRGLARTINATDAWGKPKWVWPAYYAVAGWWVLQAILAVLMSHGTVFGLVVGGVTGIIGLGLLARIEIVRGIVNIVCFLNILFGLYDMGLGFLGGGWSGSLIMVLAIMQVGMAGLMIFLIGETETRSPNF